jgi:hypothetical protein
MFAVHWRAGAGEVRKTAFPEFGLVSDWPKVPPGARTIKFRALQLIQTHARLSHQLWLYGCASDHYRPKTYTKPWVMPAVKYTLLPDTDLLEFVCEKNVDPQHMVGKIVARSRCLDSTACLK